MRPITKDRLAKYILLKMENINRLEQLAHLKADETLPASKATDGSQHTGSNDRMASAIIRRMEYEEKMQPLIDQNDAEMAEIDDAINLLDDPMEREVLRLRYIDGNHCRHLPWNLIALRLYGTDNEKALKSAYRLHRSALKSIYQATKNNCP